MRYVLAALLALASLSCGRFHVEHPKAPICPAGLMPMEKERCRLWV